MAAISCGNASGNFDRRLEKAELAKHKGGLNSCLYINKLADTGLGVLGKLIILDASTLKKTAAKKNWPVSAT